MLHNLVYSCFLGVVNSQLIDSVVACQKHLLTKYLTSNRDMSYNEIMNDRKPIAIDRNAFYDALTLAKTLGISRRQVTLLINDGRLPRNLLGNKLMWTGADILNSLASLPAQGATPKEELK